MLGTQSLGRLMVTTTPDVTGAGEFFEVHCKATDDLSEHRLSPSIGWMLIRPAASSLF